MPSRKQDDDEDEDEMPLPTPLPVPHTVKEIRERRRRKAESRDAALRMWADIFLRLQEYGGRLTYVDEDTEDLGR